MKLLQSQASCTKLLQSMGNSLYETFLHVVLLHIRNHCKSYGLGKPCKTIKAITTMNVNSEEFVEVINRLYDKFSLFAGSTVAQADEESKLEAEYKVNETCNIFGSRYEMYSEHALPKIVCLCGSTRFVDEYRCCNHQETLKGNIVLTVGCFNQYDITPPQKEALDELHKRKIDLCDEVLVIDVDGYIGTSTQSEIAYALEKGKVVRYVSQSD